MGDSTKRKVKVGIVGCGVVATAYYLPYLMKIDTAEITAVCDVYPERTAACARLFGAREQYQDYDDMLRRADIEAAFILTGSGTHEPFTLKAVQAGKHVLLQKPMALDLAGASAITEAVRRTGVKALIEPSDHSPLDPVYASVRSLVKQGALGAPYWFSYVPKGPDRPHPSLSGNPYGVGAFYSKDSGGMLFDFPYAPNKIVSVLGPCKSVMGMAAISVPDRTIVPDSRYNEFLAQVTDPDKANYWDVVLELPRTQNVRMESEDNVFSLYEMADGTLGVLHVGRLFQPMLKGTGGEDLQVFGTEGNLIFGGGHHISISSTRAGVLPSVGDDGWYHIPMRGDLSKAAWPKPIPGGFNYYHASSQHFIDCILEDRDPIPNVEWGLHITEMMHGAIESARTGQKYEMTTTVDW